MTSKELFHWIVRPPVALFHHVLSRFISFIRVDPLQLIISKSTSFWHTSFASRGFSGCMPLSAPVSLPSLDLLILHWHHPDALILTPNSSSTLPVSSSSSTPLTLPLPISRVYSNEMIYSASFNYLSPIWILQIPSILAAKSRRFVFQPPSFRTWPTILLLSCIMFRLSLITII